MMPILLDYLTLWDICFRWFGYDHRRYYFKIPLEVEDFARTLLIAINYGELPCETITLEKRDFDKDELKYSFYYWIKDFENAHNSSKPLYRGLLKWAIIERCDFKLWCERMNIPLPKFWFPEGWYPEYKLPENELLPGHRHILKNMSPEDRRTYFSDVQNKLEETEVTLEDKRRINQLIKIASQVIAINLWKQFPMMTIADMSKRDEVLNLCGAKSYVNTTIRDWLSEVAPKEVKKKRGRPPKKHPRMSEV